MPGVKIAVDAMGSDGGPSVEIEGAVHAALQYGVPIVLVGREDRIRELLQQHDTTEVSIDVVHAEEVITMEDAAATAARRKKESSIHVAARLMREGAVTGFVSAGNTGAVMTVARFLLGTLESVDRVALAAPFPNAKGGVSVMLDVGANVDSKPEHLVQFAIMGEMYYRATFGHRRGT